MNCFECSKDFELNEETGDFEKRCRIRVCGETVFICKACYDAKRANQREENKERIYLFVPYKDREAVKSLGAKWDSEKKQWYTNNYLLKQYGEALGKYTNEKVYYSIPYDLKDEAKTHGAKWDGEKKKWYFWSNSLTSDICDKFLKYKDKKDDWDIFYLEAKDSGN